jgi:trehalose synthase
VLEDYRPFAPPAMLDDIYRLAEALRGRTLQHVNSTRAGGGVAEILHRLVPLTASLGIATTWDVVQGTPDFFEVTKSFHNALQGSVEEPPSHDFQIYQQCVRDNADRIRRRRTSSWCTIRSRRT